ncbi:MAG: energy-coupling factor transporter ATPase [Clostridia bacterium]|nr:energy-coupling factor transporter ATPase [Clostridia bacterium]
MIQIKGVTSFYTGLDDKKIRAVDNLSLQIQQGEHLSIIGPNGSGKSTLAKLLNALLVPDEGEIIVDGMCTGDENNLWDIRQRVGMVFQNPDNQIVATSVEEDVAFGPENLGVPPQEILKRVDESLDLVGMGKFKNRAPHTLSGGQKQRVAIAGVIAMLPEYLVLDEPTTMLDPQGRDEVLATVDFLKKKGKSIIYITHFMEEIIPSDRVVVMDEGRIILEGTPREIFENSSLLKEVNLDVPPIAALADALRREGLPIGRPLQVKEMVSELWPLLS